MERDRLTHEVKEITFFIIFGLVMTVVIPIFIGFALGGFEESFSQGRPLMVGDFLVTYMIYYIMILAGILGLPVLKIREIFVTRKGEHPSHQSRPDAFSVSYLHDPEVDGLLYNLFAGINMPGAMKWSLSILRCFIIATLIFGGIGIFQVASQFTFVGVPQMPFQVTPFGEVFFGAEPPSFAETNLMLLVFSLLMGFNAYLVSKMRLEEGTSKLIYFSFGIFICLIVGAGWMGFHRIVYGNSEAKLWATFMFGSLGSFMTLLFGTFVFWYVWHFWNNFFYKLSELATVLTEDVIFISILAWVGLLVTWLVGEYLLYRFKKKNTGYIPQPV